MSSLFGFKRLMFRNIFRGGGGGGALRAFLVYTDLFRARDFFLESVAEKPYPKP